MGFMKNLELELGLNKAKTYLNHRKVVCQDKICKRCNTENLDFIKIVGYGNKQGIVYHYKAICLNCGFKYFVKRTKRIFDIVKNKDWIETKSFKNTKSFL